MRNNEGSRFFNSGFFALWVLILAGLPGRCLADSSGSYGDYSYTASGTNVTITDYSGLGGNLSIPSSIPGVGPVIAIGYKAFECCYALTNVAIPNSVSSIGDDAFDYCTALTSVTIGDSVNSIGGGAFYNCSKLTSLTIGNSVTYIGDWTFDLCYRLTSVNIGNSVTNIGSGSFVNCSALTNISVSVSNAAYSSLGGVLFNKNQTFLVSYPSGIQGRYTISNSVTSIGNWAFNGCSALISVTIPNSMTSIGDEAFSYCSALTSVTIPNNVTNIGSGAFELCTALTNITIPNSVTTIGSEAFYDCSKLTIARFQGDAPVVFGSSVFDGSASGIKIYYPRTAFGWSTPTWNGYRAIPYDLQPTIQLARGSGTVASSFCLLMKNSHYQLQTSTDLNSWSDFGSAFSATNYNQPFPQTIAATNADGRFLRLKIAP